jgi:hypothetical protein
MKTHPRYTSICVTCLHWIVTGIWLICLISKKCISHASSPDFRFFDGRKVGSWDSCKSAIKIMGGRGSIFCLTVTSFSDNHKISCEIMSRSQRPRAQRKSCLSVRSLHGYTHVSWKYICATSTQAACTTPNSVETRQSLAANEIKACQYPSRIINES